MFNDLTKYFQALVSSLAKNEEGQTMVEYGLILALVSVAAVAALQTIGLDVLGVFNTVIGYL